VEIMKKVIDFLKGEWNSLMYFLMFKREKTKTRTCGTIVPKNKTKNK
jgi:hypothetical protein